jgi:MFS family permease
LTKDPVPILATGHLLITAVAMLVTGWVSSRIGAKRTLVVDLLLIVAFRALAGSAGSITGIIGFRAGWGLGNALFIATSLAVIVGSASGGFAGAIVLYEAALGLGISVGPLVGGELGGISWRGPFFGVSVLMAIALVATVVLVDNPPRTAHTSITAPVKALRHRGLAAVFVAPRAAQVRHAQDPVRQPPAAGGRHPGDRELHQLAGHADRRGHPVRHVPGAEQHAHHPGRHARVTCSG